MSAAKMNAPEPPVGSRTVIEAMACQNAMSRSGPSDVWITSWANWRKSRLRVTSSLMSWIAVEVPPSPRGEVIEDALERAVGDFYFGAVAGFGCERVDVKN